jgi:hypothetical protein
MISDGQDTPHLKYHDQKAPIPHPFVRSGSRARMAWLGIQLDSAASAIDAM